MISYDEIIRSSYGTEETMRDSVLHVSDFIAKVEEVHPDIAKKFLKEQYELMNGKHLNEFVAKKLVADMWHTGNNGDKVVGEVISVDEAMQLISDKPEEKRAKCKWDAYAAANTTAHDLGAVSGLSKSDIIRIAKALWFNDEDLGNKHKVYWYFSDKIFG